MLWGIETEGYQEGLGHEKCGKSFASGGRISSTCKKNNTLPVVLTE